MKYIYIITLLCLFSCDLKLNKEVKSIDILENPSNVNISNISSSLEIVKLEKNDSCIISRIHKLEYKNKQFFILDKMFNGIFIFSGNGKFKNSINKQGRGPGEYGRIDDFLIDEEAKTIELLDSQNQQIVVYKLNDYTFLKKINLPFSFSFGFTKQDDYYYFQTNRSRNTINNKETNSEIVVLNYKNMKVSTILDMNYSLKDNQHFELGNIFYANETKNIYVSRAWSKEILTLKDGVVKDSIIINCNGKEYPDNILNGSFETKMSYLKSNKKNGKLNFFRLEYCQNNNYIVSFLNGNNHNRSYIFTGSTMEKSFCCNLLVNDMCEYPKFIDYVDCFINDAMYAYVYPSDEIDNKDLLEHYQISEEDNPIILKYKLKL